MNKNDKRFRSFTGIIYPDSTSYKYNDIILMALEYFDEFGYIQHDKDIKEDGTIKKNHIHWVGRLKNPRTIKTIANKFGLNDNDIEPVKSFKACVRYLVHFDDTDKYQYDLSDIQGNIQDIMQYFTTMEEVEVAKKMLEMRDGGYSWRDVFYEMCKLGQFNGFKRNYQLISFIREEYKLYTSDSLEYYKRNVLDKSDNNASRDN